MIDIDSRVARHDDATNTGTVVSVGQEDAIVRWDAKPAWDNVVPTRLLVEVG